MKITKSKLRQIIKEELSLMGSLEIENNFAKKHSLTEDDEASMGAVSDEIWDAYKMVVDNVGQMSSQMNEDDSYAFLMLLKKYFNRTVLEEQ